MGWSALDGLNTVLAIVGLVIIVVQARRATSAAVAARTAAESARDEVAERVTIEDVSAIMNELSEVQTALRGDQKETALHRLSSALTRLNRLRSRRGFHDDERRAAIQTIVFDLARVEERLEKRLEDGDTPLSVAKTNSSIAKHSRELADWCEQLVREDRRD